MSTDEKKYDYEFVLDDQPLEIQELVYSLRATIRNLLDQPGFESMRDRAGELIKDTYGFSRAKELAQKYKCKLQLDLESNPRIAKRSSEIFPNRDERQS